MLYSRKKPNFPSKSDFIMLPSSQMWFDEQKSGHRPWKAHLLSCTQQTHTTIDRIRTCLFFYSKSNGKHVEHYYHWSESNDMKKNRISQICMGTNNNSDKMSSLQLHWLNFNFDPFNNGHSIHLIAFDKFIYCFKAHNTCRLEMIGVCLVYMHIKSLIYSINSLLMSKI